MSSTKRNDCAIELPKVSPFLLRGFQWYLPKYLRKHFNALRIAKGTVPQISAETSVVCFVNHPGWWDPLIAHVLNERYLDRRLAYTPIDEDALRKYPVFKRLGFFGIDLDSLDGAKKFLGVTRQLLKSRETAIWMTPSGKFVDVRERIKFQPGLGHLAASTTNVTLLPIAWEYVFWEESTPEALIEFGQPIVASEQRPKNWWTTTLEDRLAETQQRLAERAIARDANDWDTILDGSAGVGGWYDFLRRIRYVLTGKSFDRRHSSQAEGTAVRG